MLPANQPCCPGALGAVLDLSASWQSASSLGLRVAAVTATGTAASLGSAPRSGALPPPAQGARICLRCLTGLIERI